MRTTLKESLRTCHDLAGSVHENNGELSQEECEIVRACIHTLQTDVLPPLAADSGPLASTPIPPVFG